MSSPAGSPVDDALRPAFRAMEVVRERPVRRDLTCVNVAWPEKERFDRFQDLFSGMLGRRLTQWETFVIVLSVAEERYQLELETFRRRP